VVRIFFLIECNKLDKPNSIYLNEALKPFNKYSFKKQVKREKDHMRDSKPIDQPAEFEWWKE